MNKALPAAPDSPDRLAGAGLPLADPYGRITLVPARRARFGIACAEGLAHAGPSFYGEPPAGLGSDMPAPARVRAVSRTNGVFG